MRIIKYPVIGLVVLFSLGSCHKIENLSNIPNIRFNSFTIFDTIDILENHSKAGKLNFYFEDGDGDIGLAQPETGVTDSTNLFLTLYRKTDGSMVSVSADDPLFPSGYRIPYMDRQGQNKILKGTITVTFLYTFALPTDTIKYDFYIEDRALNKSNVVSTSEIIISANDVYIK